MTPKKPSGPIPQHKSLAMGEKINGKTAPKPAKK